MLDVSLPIAFIFGLISFVSPCVLPLVPAYISYMGGRMLQTAEATDTTVTVGPSGQAVAQRRFGARLDMLLHGVAFVTGFTLVFVLLGVVTTALLSQVGSGNVNSVKTILSHLGGVLIIFFGLHFSGLLPALFERVRRIQSRPVHTLIVAGLIVLATVILLWGIAGRLAIWESPNANIPNLPPAPIWPDVLAVAAVAMVILFMVLGGAFTDPRGFIVKLTNTLDMMLYADTRREMRADAPNGLLGSMLMGVIFSAGWSPCIGTVYGSILTMSAMTGNVGYAALQLLAYSLGLGIPFIMAAGALDAMQSLFRKINRRMRTIKLVSGLLLVFIGLLVASEQLQQLSVQLSSGQFLEFSMQLEDSALDALGIQR